MKHSYNKPEIPGQTVCYKQEFVISEQFPMRYCSTWLKSLLCYIKKFVIEEFVIREFHCVSELKGCIYEGTKRELSRLGWALLRTRVLLVLHIRTHNMAPVLL